MQEILLHLKMVYISINLLFEGEGMDPPMLVPIALSLRLFSDSCAKELAIPAINNLSSFGFVCIHVYGI